MVRVLHDRVIDCDPKEKKLLLQAGGEVHADYIVLALGSQTEYFGIQGLSEMSFGLKSVNQAYRLKNHIDQLFEKHVVPNVLLHRAYQVRCILQFH